LSEAQRKEPDVAHDLRLMRDADGVVGIFMQVRPWPLHVDAAQFWHLDRNEGEGLDEDRCQ
jgi:hypothetical protein